eukprot:scaffold1667_cov173-Amphora_coffeaeformis.AAC.38
MEYVTSANHSIPLIHVDVLPRQQPMLHQQRDTPRAPSAEPSFLAASIKVYLLKASVANGVGKDPKNAVYLTLDSSKDTYSLLRRGFLSNSTGETESEARVDTLPENSLPLLLLPQNDVTLPSLWPCQCRGYISQDRLLQNAKEKTFRIHVTKATTIHILPPSIDSIPKWEHCLSGGKEENSIPDYLEKEVMANHTPETIRELSLRLKMMWAHKIRIGNSPDAIRRLQTQNERRTKFAEMFQARQNSLSFWSPSLMEFGSADWAESALLVHSPDHGAGKSLLVQSLARRLEPHAVVHVIRSGAILAKFGTAADAVLESALHQAVYSAAVENRPVCILLDDLDVLLTPGSPSFGDAAMPVLNSTTAYLRVLTRGLQKGIFPYPAKNPLYNVCGERGCVFDVRLCLVGIVSCPDNGGRTPTDSNSGKRSILDYLVAGKYRLPPLTASTRSRALRAALDNEGVSLEADAETVLSRLAASAVWARGSAFRRIAQCVPSSKCSADDLYRAIAEIGCTSNSPSTNVSFESSASDDLFGSVGGNAEAKLALHEALSLDPERRKIMASFGLSPPTGVLLYGPPGTGKTLLAKAVANVLQSRSASSVGGAFISLSSSDVVHAEVGTGEKLLVSAFETARMNTPSVVFIDEFQALFTDRSSGGSSRFSSTLLSLLDDVRRWEIADRKAASTSSTAHENSRNLVVLAATNTPWMVDKAFLRPGRFDHVVHVGLPNKADRQSIFELLISQMKTSFTTPDRVRELAKDLAQATEGYSGADISVVCRTAAVACLVASEEELKEEHFLSALNQVKASSSPDLVARISRWKL